MKITPSKIATIFIGIGVAILASFLILNFSPKPDIHVEVIHGKTPETSGAIEFMRIKLTNYSSKDLTNVIIDMGPEDIHNIGRIKAGESILITPKSVGISRIVINTNEGISVTKYL
ncbi:MAG: hypothetical protein ACE5KA_04990 [Nitrososphaerales archaeon]